MNTPLSDAKPQAPSRHKMTVVIYLAILPLVSFVLPGLSKIFSGVPGWAQTMLTTGVLVLLMNYLMMPLLGFWLAPQPSFAPEHQQN